MADICSNVVVIMFFSIFDRILKLIYVIAPILAIIALMIIFYKMVINPDDKKLIKKLKNTIKALVWVFLVSFVVNLFMGIVADNTSFAMCFESGSIFDVFKQPEYITIDKDKKPSPILPDRDDYESGEERPDNYNDEMNSYTNGNVIYFLNVGSADAILIQDGNHFGMIDTAESYRGSFVIKQLKMLGVNSLDFLMITHSHVDHTGNVSKIFDNFKVGTLYIKVDGAKYPAHQGIYRSVITNASKHGTSVCDVKESQCQSIHLGNINLSLYNTTFLSAKPISFGNKGRFDNANSIAALANINGKKVLFAGDIGDYFGYNQESKIANQVGDIDVYKVAHHGYVTFQNDQSVLNVLRPEYSIVSNYCSGAGEAIRRLKRTGASIHKVYCTGDGTVVLKIDENGNVIVKQ